MTVVSAPTFWSFVHELSPFCRATGVREEAVRRLCCHSQVWR